MFDIYWRRVDECAVNVERQQLVHARSFVAGFPAYPSDARAGKKSSSYGQLTLTSAAAASQTPRP